MPEGSLRATWLGNCYSSSVIHQIHLVTVGPPLTNPPMSLAQIEKYN